MRRADSGDAGRSRPSSPAAFRSRPCRRRARPDPPSGVPAGDTPRLGRPVQHPGDGRSILDVGRRPPAPQHPAPDIADEMAVPAAELLGPVVAANPPDAGRLDRLAVDDPGARLDVPALPRSLLASPAGIEPLPGAIQPKTPEVGGNGRPGGGLAGEQPPLAAGAQDGAEGVPERAQRPLPGPASRRGRREPGSEDGPLPIRQLGRIEASRGQPGGPPDGGSPGCSPRPPFSDSF